MKNSIVLDSKWVDLHCEHIIWYALVHFFRAMKKSIDKAIAKKYTKAYHIIYSLCRSTHLESNTIGFSILWFFKTALGGNLTGFEKFRGWYRPFHSLGVYVVHAHRWGGDVDFFLFLISFSQTAKFSNIFVSDENSLLYVPWYDIYIYFYADC